MLPGHNVKNFLVFIFVKIKYMLIIYKCENDKKYWFGFVLGVML